MIQCGFTILIDQREKLPYSFRGLRADADKERRMLEVPTRKEFLVTGDYTISGMEDLVCIERKSLTDLYGSVAGGRERFKAEYERMAEMEFAAVVVESSLDAMLRSPPSTSRMLPKCVFRTALSWQIKYGVHWIWTAPRVDNPGRPSLPEIVTFRLLEKFYHQQMQKRKEDYNANRRHTVITREVVPDPSTCPF